MNECGINDLHIIIDLGDDGHASAEEVNLVEELMAELVKDMLMQQPDQDA